MVSNYIEGDDPLTVHLRQFLTWLEVSNFSSFTVTNHRRTLDQFRRWCLERGIDSPVVVNRRTLEQYRRHLFYKKKENGKPLKASSQSIYLITVKLFFSWLTRNNVLLYNPSSELDLPRAEQKLPRNVLTPAEVDRVMEQPDVTNDYGIRDRAILETLYSTGLRRSECLNIEVDDVNFDKGLLFVRQGKGGKDRFVPIGARACHWIEKYLLDVRPRLVRKEDTRTLFLTQYGAPFNPDVITHKVGRYFRQAGIDRYGSCHVLRHSMATSMLENGADIRYIQLILGHARLDSTQIYTRVSIIKLKEVHSRTHPSRLKKDHESRF